MVSSVLLTSSAHPKALLNGPGKVETQQETTALRRGQVLVDTHPYGFSGGAVTAKMYLKAAPSQVWPKLTNYSRWVDYFPNIVRSEVVASGQNFHRLYQVGRKAFLAIAAQVEIYLKVYEQTHRSIQFRLEKGTFKDFNADLTLQDWQEGTLLTYTVQATPLIPVPSFLIEQGMRQDLPGNMENMRRLLCS
ncbi:MAG: SRPBCC family protein [Cyanobacteria bacterium P01_F01_bin.86]